MLANAKRSRQAAIVCRPDFAADQIGGGKIGDNLRVGS